MVPVGSTASEAVSTYVRTVVKGAHSLELRSSESIKRDTGGTSIIAAAPENITNILVAATATISAGSTAAGVITCIDYPLVDPSA